MTIFRSYVKVLVHTCTRYLTKKPVQKLPLWQRSGVATTPLGCPGETPRIRRTSGESSAFVTPPFLAVGHFGSGCRSSDCEKKWNTKKGCQKRWSMIWDCWNGQSMSPHPSKSALSVPTCWLCWNEKHERTILTMMCPFIQKHGQTHSDQGTEAHCKVKYGRRI